MEIIAEKDRPARKSFTKPAILWALTSRTSLFSGTEHHLLYLALQYLEVWHLDFSYTKLRDDPSLRWRDEIVSEVVLHAIESQDIDTVITFDRHGVSGHKNHCALYTAMAFLCLENRIPRTCRVFALRSVNILRKYSSILDVPMSFLLTPSAAYVASPNRWLQLREAMKGHESQYVWFRKLYMLFSRYVLINTFDELTANLSRSHHKRD